MSTQKPLSQMMPDIMRHIENNEEYLQLNLRIYNILEGQLKKEIEDSLAKELISYNAFKRAKERIPSVNVLKKATDKLSKVYIENPIRKTDRLTDQKLLDDMSKIMNIDAVMNQANRLLNAQKACALEPYVQDGKQRMRVLPAHTFLPYSDDPVNPLNMTVFIKLLGTDIKDWGHTYDEDGKNINEEQNEVRVVSIYQLFTDDEIVIVDSDGSLREDKMQEMGLTGSNPFGTIPQLYLNSSSFQLLPFPNVEGLDISVLIPKLLTDLNYAAQFMSHSIIWARNTDLAGQELNPDVVINLGDSDVGEGAHGTPEIGTLNPQVAIEPQLQMIEFELSAYLSSIGIKAATQGSMMPGREASGFAKAMDEGDATAARKEQTELFRVIERQMWQKIKDMQSVWSNSNVVNESRQFSDQFISSFAIKFAEMKVLKTDRQKIEEVGMIRDMGLMTKRQALKELKPDFTDQQIEKWIKELEADDEDMMTQLATQMSREVETTRDFEEDQRKEELGQ